MKRTVRTIFLLLLLTPTLAAAVDFRERIAKGTALHDQGRYEEAIAIYREVLRQDPGNGPALYELLDLSLAKSGAFEECVKVGEQGLKLAPVFRLPFYLTEGNCLDKAGKAEDAVQVYTRGLAEFPTDSPLAFNCAITQFHLHRLKQARDLLKISLAGRAAMLRRISCWPRSTTRVDTRYPLCSPPCAFSPWSRRASGPRWEPAWRARLSTGASRGTRKRRP